MSILPVLRLCPVPARKTIVCKGATIQPETDAVAERRRRIRAEDLGQTPSIQSLRSSIEPRERHGAHRQRTPYYLEHHRDLLR